MSSHQIFPVLAIKYNVVHNLLGGSNASKFKYIATVEGSQTQRINWIGTWIYLFDFISNDVITFTFIGDDLVIEETYINDSVTTDNVDVPVIKT
jgi:hypothetical protein